MWAKHAHYVSKADQKLLFNECHVNRVYEQMGVRIGQKRGAAVIDVGANVGFFATRAAEALGNVEVRRQKRIHTHTYAHRNTHSPKCRDAW